ncbi:hypothetical protein [Sphingosinicella sp. YJ22]|uniref:hypothetical protein n=1 Tax=Sphingosinicella sp. YJ22 TaxID=1104780 RepID=UPI00140C7B36|nr:hypothetical protein [Sphingosinicella sp. YJ22]
MATRGAKQIERSRSSAHEGFLQHRNHRWLKIALGLSIAALIVYLGVDVEPRHNGGSWYGYTLGTIGALLILWLTMLGVRKRAMTRGYFSLKAWTSAHVYLGLSLIVIATLHTGFQLGWNVHTLAYVLMMIVILSGIYGIIAYSTLPEALSDNRSEMTRSQMIETIAKLDRQIDIAAQLLEDTEIVRSSLKENPFRAGIFARLSGSDRNCRNARALQDMRARLATATGEQEDAIRAVVQLLERKAAALARIRRQLKIKARLEVWLFIHVPTTFALIAALSVHILSVFYYW